MPDPVSITTYDLDRLAVTQPITAIELTPGWATYTTPHGTYSIPSSQVIAVRWTHDA